MEICGQQTSCHATFDRQAGRVRRLRRNTNDGAHRLPKPGRGDTVGFDGGAAERNHAVHRLGSSIEPGDVDSVVVECDLALDGDRPILSLHGKREPEVDGAVAVYREGIDHRGEPCPQRALGEEAHGIGARALDASRNLYHRRRGAQVFDGDPGLADVRVEDAP